MRLNMWLVGMLLALNSAPRTTAAAAPTATRAWSTLAVSAPLRTLLETGKWDSTPPGFRIVALSFLADGCVGQLWRDSTQQPAAAACVARCLELAEPTRPASFRLDDTLTHGLWLSHYGLLLGARDEVQPCPDPQEHERVAQALARQTRSEPTHHVPSYPHVRYRWPADQTATLASLMRFDRAHRTHLADEPVSAWRAFVLKHAWDTKLALPWSEATGMAPGARVPRGCALSWQTRYIHEFDDHLAQQWWRQYKRNYLVDYVAMVGFREWPPGQERPADIDSGPIVNNIGTAATALAIAAARSMGDDELASRLESTAALVAMAGAVNKEIDKQAHTILAEAIRYVGAQTKRHEPE